MTIGIAATGPRAGEAILRGLQLAERIAEGAIRGFVSYAAFTPEGECLRHATQDGGTTGLNAIVHRASPPGGRAWVAERAALMSSGPNRPEPLSQFVLSGRAGCLVTGHRQPNAQRGDQQPINQRVLANLESGLSAELAVRRELAADPFADAGIIAIDQAGRIHADNSDRVKRRADIGQASLVGANACQVAVLHNAITPVRGLAELVAQAVLDVMEESGRDDGRIEIARGTPIRLGIHEAVYLDSCGGKVRYIQTTDPAMLQPSFQGAAVYCGASVFRGREEIGQMLDEPYVVAKRGQVVSLDGKSSAQLRFRNRSQPHQGGIAI